jgi:hypothetical protein
MDFENTKCSLSFYLNFYVFKEMKKILLPNGATDLQMFLKVSSNLWQQLRGGVQFPLLNSRRLLAMFALSKSPPPLPH